LTGAYGHAVARTPNLDALAGAGTRFDAAYTPYPLCAPARASFLTGRHASSLGCYDNAAILPSDVPTLAHYLAVAGYDTVLSGKMHFVGPDQLHGFRRRLTTDVFPAGLSWVPVLEEDGRFVRGGHAHNYVPPNVGVRPWTKFLAYDEETHFRALEYLRGRTAGADEPFLLVASYHHPHDPFHVTQELWDLYEGADLEVPEVPDGLPRSVMDDWADEAHDTAGVALDDPQNMRALRRAYLGLVTYVDRKLGELLDALELAGEADDTVVVFISDHGDMLGERRMVQKRCFYEWSVRVPLVVRVPGGRSAGRVVAEPVSLLDLLPTLLDLTGYEGERLPVDGESFASLLEEEPAEPRTVLSEYHVEKVRAPCFMARRGRHKLIHVHGHGDQLFDLEADPHERDDLAGRPEAADAERELLAAILERFDPEAIEAEGALSVRRRELVRRALEANGTTWDHAPVFDASSQYVR
ncbi:MAG TPA: choline-sulfatase, partial [Gaiellaceae bacterium]|nr:choline-sulfatase [Gaiellaceae bacterium]